MPGLWCMNGCLRDAPQMRGPLVTMLRCFFAFTVLLFSVHDSAVESSKPILVMNHMFVHMDTDIFIKMDIIGLT
jgi:hypothetical protein